MARLFDGASGVIDCGTAWTKPTTGTGFTIAAWIYPTGWGEANFGHITRLGADFTICALDNDTGLQSLRGLVEFTGTDIDRRAATSFIALNTWQFIVMTWSGGLPAASIRLFKGLPGGLVAESPSYTDISNGVGSLTAMTNFLVGNAGGAFADARTFAGRIGEVFYDDRVLTLAEMTALMYRMAPIPGEIKLPAWGMPAAGPEPDLSGKGNHGMITGTVIRASHPPVLRYTSLDIQIWSGPDPGPVRREDLFSYDMLLGVPMVLLYDTLLGVPMVLLYDRALGLAVPMHLLYNTAARYAMEAVFLYDTPAPVVRTTAFPYDATPPVPPFTSPFKRSSRMS